MDLYRGLTFVAPGAVIALIAIGAALDVRKIFREIASKAKEQGREIPPLAAAYFRSTWRVLLVSASAFLLTAAADAVMHLAMPDALAARVLGFSSGVALLICSFSLMVHGGVNITLRLSTSRTRLSLRELFWSRKAFLAYGLWGICFAALGLMFVTETGSVWS